MLNVYIIIIIYFLIVMTDSKRKYIYNKLLNKEIEHSYIRPFIISNNIPFSENKNGIFINITLLCDNIICDLYDIIFNYINNKVDYDRDKKIKEIQTDIINLENLEKDKSNTKVVYEKFKNLTDLDIFILKKSKEI
jgi:hypothetical protein